MGTNLAPPQSALQAYVESKFDPDSAHPPQLQHLAAQIAHNLIHEHRWTQVEIHNSKPRPMITGLPPRRLYTHPDEQTALLATQTGEDLTKDPAPEREWVLPSALREDWSLRRLAEVFDAIDITPPGDDSNGKNPWRTTKRVVLATLDDDSTVAYYIVHDGIVKPRQN